MQLVASLTLYTDHVRPEWIDYNGHMMDGYYAVAFSYATDAFLDYVGLDAAYRARSGCSTYTAEGHIVYRRELKQGAPLRFTTQLLGYDAKRMHLFHTLEQAAKGYLAATCEWMMIHVDQALGKGVEMPATTLARLTEIYRTHGELQPPPQAGRAINMGARRID